VEVTGIFGWKLGDKLKEGLELTTYPDGDLSFDYVSSTNPPFKAVTVTADPQRRIWSIRAEYDKTNGGMVTEDWEAVRRVLSEKYGNGRMVSENGGGIKFGTQIRFIQLSTVQNDAFSILCGDNEIFRQDNAAAKEKAAKAIRDKTGL
jgi:hypothetical protein